MERLELDGMRSSSFLERERERGITGTGPRFELLGEIPPALRTIFVRGEGEPRLVRVVRTHGWRAGTRASETLEREGVGGEWTHTGASRLHPQRERMGRRRQAAPPVPHPLTYAVSHSPTSGSQRLTRGPHFCAFAETPLTWPPRATQTRRSPWWLGRGGACPGRRRILNRRRRDRAHACIPTGVPSLAVNSTAVIEDEAGPTPDFQRPSRQRVTFYLERAIPSVRKVVGHRKNTWIFPTCVKRGFFRPLRHRSSSRNGRLTQAEPWGGVGLAGRGPRRRTRKRDADGPRIRKRWTGRRCGALDRRRRGPSGFCGCVGSFVRMGTAAAAAPSAQQHRNQVEGGRGPDPIRLFLPPGCWPPKCRQPRIVQ